MSKNYDKWNEFKELLINLILVNCGINCDPDLQIKNGWSCWIRTPVHYLTFSSYIENIAVVTRSILRWLKDKASFNNLLFTLLFRRWLRWWYQNTNGLYNILDRGLRAMPINFGLHWPPGSSMNNNSEEKLQIKVYTDGYCCSCYFYCCCWWCCC